MWRKKCCTVVSFLAIVAPRIKACRALVHRELEFLPVGASEGSKRPVTDFAASCREGLSHSCQSRSLPDRGGVRDRTDAVARPVPAPVLAPGVALGVLPSRALSSAQAISDSRRDAWLTQPPTPPAGPDDEPRTPPSACGLAPRRSPRPDRRACPSASRSPMRHANARCRSIRHTTRSGVTPPPTSPAPTVARIPASGCRATAPACRGIADSTVMSAHE